MAASLDEIQGHDLFLQELDLALEQFLMTKPGENKLLNERFILNAFIEYLVFNLFLESEDQIDRIVLSHFKTWIKCYAEIDFNEDLIIQFLYFIKTTR